MKMLVLENVRSAYNVGAIFRTADATGVGKIYLVGYTPLPIDRFGRIQKEIEKTSLGASKTVPWSHCMTITEAVIDVRQQGGRVVVVEQQKDAVSLPHFHSNSEDVYVFGNEVDGVSAEGLAQADTIVEIPMLGTKESLNVSVAVGVILYHGIKK